MKKLLLLLLCVPLIGVGQTEYKKTYHENGSVKIEGNLIDGYEDGIWKEYYKNGQLRYEINFKNGKQHGIYKSYFKNGQIQFFLNFKEGKLDDICRRYYEAGQLYSETIWENKMIISQTCWDEEGNRIDCE